MRDYEHRRIVYRTTECSDCGHRIIAPVYQGSTTDGIDVRCGECGHCNWATRTCNPREVLS